MKLQKITQDYEDFTEHAKITGKAHTKNIIRDSKFPIINLSTYMEETSNVF